METGQRLPWSPPSIEVRDDFLSKMQSLASRFVQPVPDSQIEVETETAENQDEIELKRLLDVEEYATAFFMARRLLTRGEEWAQPYLLQSQQGLEAGDDVQIP